MDLTSKMLGVFFFTRNFAIVQVFTIVHSFYYSWHADSPFVIHGFYQ